MTAPGAEIDEGHPLVAALGEAHGEVFGAPAERDVTRWFSDASVLTRYGIATVNYGTSSRAAGRRARRESRHRGARQDGGGLRARGDEGVRRRMTHDVYTLPPNLPVPEDDGAADHLLGTMLPQLTLESSQGPVRCASWRGSGSSSTSTRARAGRAGRPAGMGRHPRRARVHAAVVRVPRPCRELAGLGALVAGLSAQPLDDQSSSRSGTTSRIR